MRRFSGLLGDTSPALERITTTKTTPPTPDIPKLQLREATDTGRERVSHVTQRQGHSHKKREKEVRGEREQKRKVGRRDLISTSQEKPKKKTQ